jgi:DNA-binding SARP family transcriptional activator
MSELEVRLFGRFAVRHQGNFVEILGAKARELFCYLLLNSDQVHNREALAELLWQPDGSTQPRKYLRNALWQLQRALELHRDPQDPLIIHVEPGWIHIDSDALLWVDVAVFARAFVRVQGVPGQELSTASVQALHEAIDLYRGDLLEGEYQDWCILERERLQNMYLAMLDKLIDYCESHGEYDAGLVYGGRILRHDPAREKTHRRIMRLHYFAGDRAAALRQFERCAAALARDLDVRPSSLTKNLYRQIQADQLGTGAEDSVPGLDPMAPSVRPLPEVLNHLQEVVSMLAELHRHLQQDIMSFEQTLDSSSS